MLLAEPEGHVRGKRWKEVRKQERKEIDTDINPYERCFRNSDV